MQKFRCCTIFMHSLVSIHPMASERRLMLFGASCLQSIKNRLNYRLP